jgi:hypothetical protein
VLCIVATVFADAREGGGVGMRDIAIFGVRMSAGDERA